jgi:excisionase family DNA binding protein
VSDIPETAVVYTTSEVALKLSASEATVRRWADAGTLPGAFKPNPLGEWRFVKAEIDAMLERAPAEIRP